MSNDAWQSTPLTLLWNKKINTWKSYFSCAHCSHGSSVIVVKLADMNLFQVHNYCWLRKAVVKRPPSDWNVGSKHCCQFIFSGFRQFASTLLFCFCSVFQEKLASKRWTVCIRLLTWWKKKNLHPWAKLRTEMNLKITLKWNLTMCAAGIHA